MTKVALLKSATAIISCNLVSASCALRSAASTWVRVGVRVRVRVRVIRVRVRVRRSLCVRSGDRTR